MEIASTAAIENRNTERINYSRHKTGQSTLTRICASPRVAIFDYGAGNLFSLKAALERNGARNVSIIKDMKSIINYDGLILPGVGNFDPAIESIGKDKKFLISAIEYRLPILGICLGMEMLFNCSEEGGMEGLKIIDGAVRLLDKKKVKVPHMGWNNIKLVRRKTNSVKTIKARNHDTGNKNSRLLRYIKDNSWVYFVHSYRIFPGRTDGQIVVANTRYGDSKIPAVIEKENIFGTQFHPEKSGPVGSQIIRNFLKICSSNTITANALKNR